jgi:aspartyl-tRNA(Asn)/glutamyl-tRNA(Gln) amidotransferase subunit A
VVGVKPSRGRVAVYPPSAVGFLSHAGPITRTVCDAALMLQVIAGADERDLGSLPADATEYLQECEKAVRGLRVAWSVDLGYAPLEPEIGRICASAAQVFATDLGCVVEETHPGWQFSIQAARAKLNSHYTRVNPLNEQYQNT